MFFLLMLTECQDSLFLNSSSPLTVTGSSFLAHRGTGASKPIPAFPMASLQNPATCDKVLPLPSFVSCHVPFLSLFLGWSKRQVLLR